MKNEFGKSATDLPPTSPLTAKKAESPLVESRHSTSNNGPVASGKGEENVATTGNNSPLEELLSNTSANTSPERESRLTSLPSLQKFEKESGIQKCEMVIPPKIATQKIKRL